MNESKPHSPSISNSISSTDTSITTEAEKLVNHVYNNVGNHDQGAWLFGNERSRHLWGRKNCALDSFFSVVQANRHSLQVFADRLQDLDLANDLMGSAGATIPAHRRVSLIVKLRELDITLRGFARLFQALVEEMAKHFRLTSKEQHFLERRIQEINVVIHLVHQLLLDCSQQSGCDGGSIRDPLFLRNANFRLRGITFSWKRIGLGHIRRSANVLEAKRILASFADQLSRQLIEVDRAIVDLADLQHNMLVETQMQIEMDAQAFVKGLQRKFSNGFHSTREMAQSMRAVEEYHNNLTAANKNQKDEKAKENMEVLSNQVPEVDTIVQAVQRALEEERHKWRSDLQTQEINLEIEKYHKSVLINKYRQHELKHTITLVLVAILSAGLAFLIARYES